MTDITPTRNQGSRITAIMDQGNQAASSPKRSFIRKGQKGRRSERKSRWSQYDRGGTIQEWDTHPDAIYEGSSGELLAIKKIQSGKYIVVAYKEVSKTDGFVITAFLTSKMRQFERRKKVWSRQK